MGSEWEEVPFDQAVMVNPSIRLEKGREYSFVEMAAVDPNRRGVSESERRKSGSGGARFRAFDTLLSRITPCLENGKIARFEPSSRNPEELAFGSTEFIVIRGRDGVTDNNFAYYLTKWEEFRQFAIGQMTGSSGRQRVPADSLSGFRTPVPPLPEQRAIAHVLGSLDDKIELNRKMNATLEAMAQALFKSWFVDFDPVIDNALAAGNPIPEEFQARATARESLGDARRPLPEDLQTLFPDSFLQTEEVGWIPQGWEAKSVSNALSINPAEKLKKRTVATHADMKALPTEGFSVDEVVSKAYTGGSKFRNGDILLARITPCLENGKTAVVDFLEGDEVGFGSTEFIVLRGKKEISTSFMACLSRLERFREHCIVSMVGSSGRQRVQNACFDNYYLKLPPQPGILSAFDGLTGPHFQRITYNVQANRYLSKARDTLLPKLLSGELRLPLEEIQLEVAV